ncbi:MAG: Cobalamin biosynthesis protein CbiB, partial [Alphaproteobacteria bacterium MarineAlpha10_Bin3]
MTADPLIVIALALILDAVVGDMRWLFRAIPHPVVLIGRLIGFLDNKLNRAGRGVATVLAHGLVVTVLVSAVAAGSGWALSWAAERLPYGVALELFCVTVMV